MPGSYNRQVLKLACAFALLFVMTLQPTFVLAQTEVGAVSGRVTDPSGAAKWTILGRFNYSPSHFNARQLFNLSIAGGNFVKTTTSTFGLTGVLTPRLTNDLRVNDSATNAYQTHEGGSFGGIRGFIHDPNPQPESLGGILAIA